MTGFYLEKRKTSQQLRTLFRRQASPSVMVWAVSDVGRKKAPIIFVEEAELKIDQAVYLHFLSERRRVHGYQESILTALFLFQQDEASIPYQQIGSKLLH
ncbi:Hypothetical protein FKW44_023098 [Caligus rogercresseyi]|uniref:Uncharacterized protein n=1 Tax=Caligus rogercresseyi TaxID=217165 RepID=A0A7T8JU04_CALRO|nr:Hypothetical protein FKW44_023098 [Caligus rogercresseyi]